MLPLTALLGGIIGGPLLEILGRKTTIMSTAIPFMGAGKFEAIGFLSISLLLHATEEIWIKTVYLDLSSTFSYNPYIK